MEERTEISAGASLDRIVGLLDEKQCSCVIAKGESVRFFYRRGVKDLYELLKNEPEALAGALVADRVVGKGAAALMILGGVSNVYAHVASSSALELFRQAGVPVQCGVSVPHIINRAGTGMCPVEQRCMDADTPRQCLIRIEEFLKTIDV